MTAPPAVLRVSSPGRICLFGEHQDYLHLPVIPAAIALRITVDARARTDHMVAVDLPDIGTRESFSLDGPLEYTGERDYLRSAVNVLRRHGFTFSRGRDCTVRGNIPINAGTSSSSALVVSWVNLLARASDQSRTLTADHIARLAHEAEVIEFGEPGGMMDHLAAAYGGLLFIDFTPDPALHPISAPLGSFVLGDSLEPKDTKRTLAGVKNRVLEIVSTISARYPGIALRAMNQETLASVKHLLDPSGFSLLQGTVTNHSITLQAKDLLARRPLDHRRLGALLNEHQAVLRDILRISTPRIDRMLDAALDAGATGGKINGSGGGGCMFAYAPVDAERVAEAIARAGGKPHIVAVDAGTRCESGETLP
jgi:galactokinase